MDAKNGTTPTLKDLRTQRRTLEEQLRLHAVQRAARQLGFRQNLLESAQVPDWVNSYVDLLDRYRDGNQLLTPIATPNDRRFGRNFPLFQTEQELALLRGPARILVATNTYAQGMLSGLTSYVIGTGYSYSAYALSDDADAKTSTGGKGLVERVQDELDQFTDPMAEQCWPELEAELFWRSSEDGEFFLRHGLGDDGLTWVRTVEPEQVIQPPGSNQAEWSFGMQSDPNDAQKITLFNVCHMADITDCEEVSPDEMVHCKINTKRSIKRGLTDFAFDTYDTLQVAGRLRRNIGEGAALQAAIALIRQHQTSTVQQVQTFQDTITDYQRSDPVTGRVDNYRQRRPGEELDIPAGYEYVEPPGASNVEGHIDALHACLRCAGVKWNAPEWLATASGADMAAYTASLTAGSPFLKKVESLQEFFKRRFLRTMRIVIRHAVEAGRLPPDVLAKVGIDATAKSSEIQDKLAEAQANQIRVGGGWKSKKQCAEEEGSDWDQVQLDNEEDRERTGGDGTGLQLPPDDGGGEPPASPFAEAVLEALLECGGAGGTPGPCATGGDDDPPAESRTKRILKAPFRAIAKQYQALESEFGRAGAIGLIAVAALPVPGTFAAPIAAKVLRKGYLALKARMQGPTLAHESADGDLLGRKVAALRALLAHVHELTGEEMPEVSDADLAGLVRQGVRESKDAAGHEHGDDGRFGAGGTHAHLGTLKAQFPDASDDKLQSFYDRGHGGGVGRQAAKPGEPAVKTTAGDHAGNAEHLTASLGNIDAAKGGHNFVHLGDLRAAHPELSKVEFDAALTHARRSGKITLSKAEGRGGVTDHDRGSAVYEPEADGHHAMLLYASLRK